MNNSPPAVHRSASVGFAAKADRYVRGRPDYPDEIVQWLQSRLGLAEGKVALDLGAGTGKFTAYLLRTGARIIAIEPVLQMREQLRCACPGVDAREGTATSIPVPNSSVDAVICAQAFHWFATRDALAEICRALKPGGKLGLIWNMRDETVDWVAKLTEIIAPYEGDTPRFAKGTWKLAFPFEGLSALREDHFGHEHAGSPEDVIIDRIRSISFIAALPADDEAKVVGQLRGLIASTPALMAKDIVSMPYTTAAFWAEKIA